MELILRFWTNNNFAITRQVSGKMDFDYLLGDDSVPK